MDTRKSLPTAPNVPPLRSRSPCSCKFTGLETGLLVVSNRVVTGHSTRSEESILTGLGNGSALFATEMSSTWSSSARVSSGLDSVVFVCVRFLVVRERRLRLAPLLLMVLASEFEREVPGNLEEEGSCMGFVAGSFVQDKVPEPLWGQHKPGSAKHPPSNKKQ
jgi:hypothetical protein